jgi:hypothetical protein
MNDDKEPQGPNPWMKSLMIWLGILLLIGTFVSLFARDQERRHRLFRIHHQG